MKGGVYTREKCSICGKGLKLDDRREVLTCPDHPQISGTGKCFVKFGRDINKRFPAVNQAIQFLYGLRFKTVEGSYDAKDYQADKPYSFTNLSEKYLKRKSHLKSIREARCHIKAAQDYFQDRNVKEITGADIEDYLYSLENISEKTRANYCSRLSDFWKWILRRGIIDLSRMPMFPKIEYELAYRTITDMGTQEQIINEVWRLVKDINPKIWFGIDLLATYVNIRPGDLLKIRERDINLEHGLVTIHHPTKKKNKVVVVRLLEHHIKLFQEMKKEFPALPEVKFFRHHGDIQRNMKPGQPFGINIFRRYWNRACKRLNVEGLDMYGGTRHTTTTEIARQAGTENARKASAHETNKAFDRYCQFQDDTAFKMAQIVKGKKGKKIVNINDK